MSAVQASSFFFIITKSFENKWLIWQAEKQRQPKKQPHEDQQ